MNALTILNTQIAAELIPDNERDANEYALALVGAAFEAVSDHDLKLLSDAKSAIYSLLPLFTEFRLAHEVLSGAGFTLALAEASLMSAAMAGPAKIKTVGTYIVKNPASGLLKIGKSSDILTRLRSLSVGSGARLELIAEIDRDIEASLHEEFSHLRVFGEWFRDDGSIVEKAKQLTLDLSAPVAVAGAMQ